MFLVINAVTVTPTGTELTDAGATVLGGAFIVILLLVLLSFPVWIWSLVHILRNDNFKDGTTKALWALFVFFFYAFGSVLYFLFGRPKKLK